MQRILVGYQPGVVGQVHRHTVVHVSIQTRQEVLPTISDPVQMFVCISAQFCSMMVQACGWCRSAGSYFAPTSGQQDHSCSHCDEAVAAWRAKMQTANAAPVLQALSVKSFAC